MSDDMKIEMCVRLFFGCAFSICGMWEIRDAMMCATLCDCELGCRLNIERKLLLVLLSTTYGLACTRLSRRSTL